MDGALAALGALGQQACEVVPGLSHLEVFTTRGLLTVLWHGDPASRTAVVCAGGAMGGLLGPAGGLYQRVGAAAAAAGRQALRVSYRRPNDLEACAHDVVAACELAARGGAERFALLGHSFGGAVVLGAGVALGPACAGICTFATQSAGAEVAQLLPDEVPLLLLHGDRDEILPADCSFVVREIAAHGEVEVVPGAGHLFDRHAAHLDARVGAWLDEVLA